MRRAIGLGNDGRRSFDYAQDVKAFAHPFNLPLPQGSTSSPMKDRGGRAGDQKSFDEFIRHQFQSWVFVSFEPSQKKEPLGGGEPRQDCAKARIESALRFLLARDPIAIG